MKDHPDKDYRASLIRIVSAAKIISVLLAASIVLWLLRIQVGFSKILLAFACLTFVLNLPDLINVIYLHRENMRK